MFRAELLDLRALMGFLRMGSTAAPAGAAAAFEVPHVIVQCLVTEALPCPLPFSVCSVLVLPSTCLPASHPPSLSSALKLACRNRPANLKMLLADSGGQAR